MTMPSFEVVKQIIEDVSEFIKDFIAKLKDFIGGFKKDISFEAPTATEAPIGDGE
jgi:hypothetical protein